MTTSPSNQAIAGAVADLARWLSIEAETIRIVRWERIEWSDAALGCPQPGRFVAQVVTPGHLITLEAAGRLYEYHEGDERVILCRQRSMRGR